MQQKKYLIKICSLCFVLPLLTLVACKKAQPVATQRFSELSIPMLFSDTPPIDLYLNGALADSSTTGGGFRRINIPLGTPVKITLKKAHEQVALLDTVVTATTNTIFLMYAYSEALGFNKFMSSTDFTRPAQDSAAFMVYNNYQNFGNDRIDVLFYVDKNGNSIAEPVEQIGALRNIPLGKLSEKISFPKPVDPGEELNIYFLVVDPATQKNIDNEIVNKLYGLPENQLAFNSRDVFPSYAYGPPYGAINVARVDAFPYEMDVDDGTGTGGTVHKLFNLYTVGYFFKY